MSNTVLVRTAVAVCVAVLASLSTVVAPPLVESADAATACAATSGAGSTTTPPATIRILQTNAARVPVGVIVVDFQVYIASVLSSEWPQHLDKLEWVESLKAGAVASKTYAWFWMKNGAKGGVFNGSCYDLADRPNGICNDGYAPPSATDSACAGHGGYMYGSAQRFVLNREIYPSNWFAVTATWNIVMHRNNSQFDSGYRATLTSPEDCGAGKTTPTWKRFEPTGGIMSQAGADLCAYPLGYDYATILGVYYPGVRVFDPTALPPTYPVVTQPVSGMATAGGSFTIYGSGLSGSTVTVGDINAAITSSSDDFITFTVPEIPDYAGSGMANSATNASAGVTNGTVRAFAVTVRDRYGQTVNAGSLSVTVIPGCQYDPSRCPGAFTLSPNSGPLNGGTRVTISGSTLGQSSVVYFGDCATRCIAIKEITFNGNGSITVTAPNWGSVASVPVSVTNPNGYSPKPHPSYYFTPGKPKVTGVSPKNSFDCSPPRVTITGQFLGGTYDVFFGGVKATIVKRNPPNSVVVAPPVGLSGTVDVVVASANGTTSPSNNAKFTYAPVLCNYTPGWSGWRGLGGNVSGSMSAVSFSRGHTDAFFMGSDKQLWHSWSVGPTSVPAQPLGGKLKGDPVVVSWGNGRIDVFARGTSDQLLHWWLANNRWNGPENLGATLGSDPSAVTLGVNNLHVFWKAGDSSLKTKSYSAAGWSAVGSLGGTLGSAPHAIVGGPGRVDVFWRGADNGLKHKSFAGSWSGTNSLGGNIVGRPSAVAWAPGRLDVFARGGDDRLKHWYFQGAWSAIESHEDAKLTSDPSVVSWANGHLDIYFRGTDNALYHRWWTGSSWSMIQGLGGGLAGDPMAKVSGYGVIDVYVKGTDKALYVNRYGS